MEMELRRLAEHLLEDEDHFVEILTRKSAKDYQSEKKQLESDMRKSGLRLEILPKLLKRLYEDNINGKTTDYDYNTLSTEYAEEREGLKKKILQYQTRLRELENREGERDMFVTSIRRFLSMRVLTKQLLNELIDRIDVYETECTGKNRTQRVVIYYKFVGYLDLPGEAQTFTEVTRQGVAVEYVSCEPQDDILEEDA